MVVFHRTELKEGTQKRPCLFCVNNKAGYNHLEKNLPYRYNTLSYAEGEKI